VVSSVQAADDYAEKYGFQLEETEELSRGHVVARFSEPPAPGDEVQAYTFTRIMSFVPDIDITIHAGDVHQALRTAIVSLTRSGWTVHESEIDADVKDAADLMASRGSELETFSLDRQVPRKPLPSLSNPLEDDPNTVAFFEG
jgi:hypothetical protein